MPDTEELWDRLVATDFRAWYREYTERRNARNGRFSRNTPDEPPKPEVNRPHTVLTCHRKQRYREENTPAEEPAPRGRFWVGSRIEEDLVLDYLADIAPDGVLVGNSLWVDAPLETADREIRLQGLTDPVFATRDGTPLLPTEVKTKRDVSTVDGPSEHHRAQLHAYIHALSVTRDVDLDRGALVYVSRVDLDATVIDVPFDEVFWNDRVVPWMADHTAYRRRPGIPPARPEQNWECDNCEFRIRCGKTDDPVDDAGFDGFVPRHRYPRGRVEAALAADDGRVLSPTLARAYPDIAEDAEVADWTCEACGATVPFTAVSGGADEPTCQRCAENGQFARLRGSPPDAVPIVDLSDHE